MASSDKNLIVVTGPTGVGKTELCISLAEHFGVEIINADSRQIYREIPIGTAAPTAGQLKRVKHHCVATHGVTDYYSAAMYERDVMTILADMKGNGNVLAVLTGGSMMYIDAVCNGIDDIPTIRADVRELMKRRLEEEGLEALDRELKLLDPVHWEQVDHNNPRRVVHALEVCHQTGKKYSSFRIGQKKERPFNIIKIGLTLDTIDKIKRGQIIYNHNALYERINARVLDMIDKGLLGEVRRMCEYRNNNALNTVGYKELFRYLDNEICFEEAIRQIQSNTREYARKQLTWFKRDKDVTWFLPDDFNGIIKHIDNNL